MGFRIHRGAWQFKDSSNRFVTKYKLDTAGRLKETDADGNILDDAFMDKTASANIPAEYLTQTEGDARYIRTNEVRSGTTGYSLTFKKADGVRTGVIYWDGSGSQFGLLNKDGQWAVRTTEYDTSLYYDGSRKLRTTNTGVYIEGDAIFQNWVRVKNNDGLYFQDRGGGWYMPDSTYIRAYNNKSIRTDGEIWGSRFVDVNDTNYFLNPHGVSYLNDVRVNIIYDRNNTGYYLNLDETSKANYFDANYFRDRNNTNYYLRPSSTSRLVRIDGDEYNQIGHGNPRNNLGSPTITEMALFESQFTCKTDLSNDYDDMSDLTFWVQQNEGDAWTEVIVPDGHKRRFLRTNNSNVEIPNGAYKFRVEFNGRHYTFANAIYFYWSSNSHNSQVHIWKKRCSDGQWLQHTNSTTTVSSWPGHLYLPFSTIPWNENNTTSTGHYTHIRVEFTPNWSTGNYADRNINLQGGQVWGGYPSGRRTPHRITEDGNYIFPSSLYADGSGGWGDRLLKRNDILGTDITSQNWNDFISGDSQFSVRSATGASGSNKPSAYNYGLVMSAHESGGGKLQIYGPHNGSENGTGLWFRTGWGGDFDPWAEIWHSNNDGSGSGLDADLLDGQQGSHYLNYNNLTNKPSTFPPSSHNHDRLHEKGTIDFGASYLQWTDNHGTGGDGLNGNAPENPFSDWHHHLIQNHANNGGYYVDIASSFHNDRIHFRRMTNGSKSPWREFWHTGNLSTTKVSNWDTAYGWGNHASAGYLTSLPSHNHNSSYLQLSGGTLTGNLTINARIQARNLQNNYQRLDIDAIKDTGLYTYDGGITGTQPEGTNWYNLRTIEIGYGQRFTQMAFPYNADRVWFRRQVNTGTWQPWFEFITTANRNSHLTWNNLQGKPSTFTPPSTYLTTADNDGRYLRRQGAQIISKDAHDAGASAYHLELHSPDTGDGTKEMSIRFHQSNRSWGQLRFNGDFKFTNGSDSTYKTLRAGNIYSSDNLVATQTWVGSQGYLTSLPSHNHDDRYFTESEANTMFAYKAGSASQDFYVDDLYYDAWLRNHTNGNGMYWSNSGWHLYIASNNKFRFRSGNSSSSAILFNTNGTDRNAIYNSNANDIGFLNTSGSWNFKVQNNGNVNLYGSVIASNGVEIINGSGQWVGDNSGLVGPQGPQGDRGPAGADGRDGSDASISFTNQESGQSSSVTSITFNRGEAQFTMADGSVMTIGNARMG